MGRKFIMYLSAFLPIFVVLWFKAVFEGVRKVLEAPHEYIWSSVYLNPYLIVELICFLSIGLCLSIFIHRNQNAAVRTVKLKSVKNRSAEYYLSYYSVFILALAEFSITNPIDIAVLVLLLIFLGIVYIRNGLFYMNPTINIFLSYIYEVEYDEYSSTSSKLIISSERLSNDDVIEMYASEFDFALLCSKNQK